MNYALLEAAVSCGSPFIGSEYAYDALLQAGLSERLLSAAPKGSGVSLYPMEKVQPKNADYSVDLLYLVECLTVSENLRCGVKKALAEGQFPVIIGGDHSVAMGSLAALGETYGAENLALVYIDAHADSNTEQTSETHRIHGMDLAEAMGLTDTRLRVGQNDRDLFGRNIYMLGSRSVDPGEWPILEAQGVHVYTDRRIAEEGLPAVLKQVTAGLAGKKVAVSFDVDSMDPAYFTATGYTIPNGFSPEQAKEILRTLFTEERKAAGGSAAGSNAGSYQIVSMECVEYNPQMDPKGTDAQTVLDILETLGILAQQRG